jgi:hypothetical protein
MELEELMLLVAIRTALYIRPFGDELLTIAGRFYMAARTNDFCGGKLFFFFLLLSPFYISFSLRLFCFPSRQIANNRLL